MPCKDTDVGRGPADPARGIAELEAQAAELEVKARDLRGRIAALKKPRSTGSTPKDKDPGPGSSRLITGQSLRPVFPVDEEAWPCRIRS